MQPLVAKGFLYGDLEMKCRICKDLVGIFACPYCHGTGREPGEEIVKISDYIVPIVLITIGFLFPFILVLICILITVQ